MITEDYVLFLAAEKAKKEESEKSKVGERTKSKNGGKPIIVKYLRTFLEGTFNPK